MAESGVSVPSKVKELCRLVLPSSREGASNERSMRRGTATAFDRLLFWDGGDGYAGGSDEGDAHLLHVAENVYSMRRSGREGDADRLVFWVCVCEENI